MFLAAGLATLQRYLGVVLFGVGGCWWFCSKYGLRGSLAGDYSLSLFQFYRSVYGSFSIIIRLAAPFWATGSGRDVAVGKYQFIFDQDILVVYPKVSFLDPLLLRPWILLVGIHFILILVNKKTDWFNWL